MKIAVPKEIRPDERRVAASPETVKKFRDLGFDVVVEKGAGVEASFTDDAYVKAGATIADDAAAACADADIVLKVQRPMTKEEGEADEVALLREGAVLIGLLDPYSNPESLQRYNERKVTAFAMELLPRITRAQSMDVLSSQSNLAGYKAVLDAAFEFGRAMPMMMTAAGTVAPARVLVLGAGVAGLQAIATAKRLGGIVSAFDVRPAVKEQVESLGAKFVEVESEEVAEAETAGGYAKEMSEAYKKKQAEALEREIAKVDMVVTTAQIPGKPAPKLISKAMVDSMKPGSVIVDLASATGGNCEVTEHGEIVRTDSGVTVIGHANMPSRVAVDASALYAKNLFNFLSPLYDKEAGTLTINPEEDEIVRGTLLTRDGAVVHANFKEEAEQ